MEKNVKLQDIGQIIATREFALSNGDRITVSIGKPEPFPDGIDFYCPWRLIGPSVDKIRYSGGVDSVSALLLALKSIGAELNTRPEGISGDMKWIGSQPEDNIGFPVPDTCLNLLEDKKRRLKP